MTYHPTAEQVAVAWLKGVAGVSAANVGDTLPEDTSTWSSAGFARMTSVVGGTPGMYAPRRDSIVQIDCFAVNPSSQYPPWGKAGQLAQLIINDTYPSPVGTEGRRVVTANLPSGFYGARVQTAYPMNEPRRTPADQGFFARYTLEIALVWVEVPS